MPSPTLLALAARDRTPLAGLLWPAPPGAPGVVIVPGLGSRKENHRDMGERLAEAGMAALAIDLRGHGSSGGRLDGGCLDDVRTALDALSSRGHRRLGLRGSSMGGMLAIAAAPTEERVRCVVAICPARPVALAERVGADWPRELDLPAAARRCGDVAFGFWHATGDEAVPWAHSFALSGMCGASTRLRIVLGGSHRSLQHDPSVLDQTTAFLRQHLYP